jgi:hypothetical protein
MHPDSLPKFPITVFRAPHVDDDAHWARSQKPAMVLWLTWPELVDVLITASERSYPNKINVPLLCSTNITGWRKQKNSGVSGAVFFDVDPGTDMRATLDRLIDRRPGILCLYQF